MENDNENEYERNKQAFTLSAKEKNNKELYFGIVAALCVCSFWYYIIGGRFGLLDYLSLLWPSRFPWVLNGIPEYILGIVDAALKFIFYGIIGYFIYKASLKLGFKNLWNENIKSIRALAAMLVAVIITVALFAAYNAFMWKNYRISVVFVDMIDIPPDVFISILTGIGEEFRYKILGITLAVVIFFKLTKSEKWLNVVFWIASLVCAVLYGTAMISVTLSGYGGEFHNMPSYLRIVIAFPYALFFMLSAYFFKRYGLLSSIFICLLVDFTRRILWI